MNDLKIVLDQSKIQQGKLGIDNLKIVLSFLLFVSYQLAELTKKFSFNAAVQLAFQIAENMNIITQGKAALKELRDLDVPESQEVADFIGLKFDLVDDSIELRIEAGIQLVPEGYELLKKNINYYLKVRGWIKSWGDNDSAIMSNLGKKITIEM